MPQGLGALYIDYRNPHGAVYYARDWVPWAARQHGLAVAGVVRPLMRGAQWVLVLQRAEDAAQEIELPPDEGRAGRINVPDLPTDAHQIGLRET